MENVVKKKASPIKRLFTSLIAGLTSAVMLMSSVPSANAAVLDPGHVLYIKAHVQNIGWMAEDVSYPPDINVVTGQCSGEQYRDVKAGTTGRSLRLESLEIGLLDLPKEWGGIMVNAHVANIGWQGYEYADCDSTLTVGTTGRSLAIEAVQIRLYGRISNYYSVEYSVHSAYLGWGPTRRDGEVAGTVGQSRRAEAIHIRIVPKKK